MPDQPENVDAYIAAFPPEVQTLLRGVREAIRSELPEAPEAIRYGMPAVMLGRREAIYFAGWKKHIAVYPVARSDGPIEAELAPYRAEKDSLHFRLDRPLPYDLIARVASLVAGRYGYSPSD